MLNEKQCCPQSRAREAIEVLHEIVSNSACPERRPLSSVRMCLIAQRGETVRYDAYGKQEQARRGAIMNRSEEAAAVNKAGCGVRMYAREKCVEEKAALVG